MTDFMFVGTDWDYRWMAYAQSEHLAGWSKDRSTKLGCVIVGPDREIRTMGYNGFPRGCDDDVECRHERPLKYKWTEHAERNAIYNAARVGIPLKGCTAYIPWFPCTECARALIQVGIARIVCYRPDPTDPRWGEDFAVAAEMLGEAAPKIVFIEKEPTQ